MSISVIVDASAVGLLTIDLLDASAGINERVADVMRDTGPTMVRTMKQEVRVDTGALQRSLGYSVNKSPRLRVGVTKRVKNKRSGKYTASYAGFVHAGTWRMAPNPFIDIAVKRHTTPQGKFMRGLRKAGVANIGRSTGGLR